MLHRTLDTLDLRAPFSARARRPGDGRTARGTVGDVLPQHLTGVAGINGFGENTAPLAVLLTGAITERYRWSQVFVGAGMLRILAMLSVCRALRRRRALDQVRYEEPEWS